MTAHLWEVDRNRILQIPVGATTSKDRLVWHYSKNGIFSVSSCYHMIFSDISSVTQPGNEEGQGSGDSTINWSVIWKLNIPPKVRMFLWRATLDTLPHRAELFRRRIASSPFCERCPESEETSMHILRACRGLDEIWLAAPFSMQLEIGNISFWAWLVMLKKRLEPDTFLLAVVVMWKTWETRNLETHGTKRYAPTDIVTWGQEFLERYWSAQVSIPVSAVPSTPSVWCASPPGFIKINTDASFPVNGSDALVSMVARSNSGECVWWSKKRIIGRPLPVDGEALAFLHGLQIAINHGWRSVIMESDCLQLVNSLSRATSSLASFGAILESCVELFPLFQNISFCYIRRLGNVLAHRLATSIVIPCSEGASLPPELDSIDE